MNELNVQVEVEVKLTEDWKKVKQAVENVFGRLDFEQRLIGRRSLLTAQTLDEDNLSKLANLLRRERIRDAARSVLFQGLQGNTITFFLNKQVAFSGHVSFCGSTAESPLGPIKVQIKTSNPKSLIDWLAPRTTRRRDTEKV